MGSIQDINKLANILNTDPTQIRKLFAFCKPLIDDITIAELNSGGNNIVLKIIISNNVYALKKYNTSKYDDRDRLKTEWDFLSLVKSIYSDCPIPSPYALNEEVGIAVYEFIDGSSINSENLTSSDIYESARFIRLLNTPKIQKLAINLSDASDAEFSIDGHIEFVKSKINGLFSIKDQEPASLNLLSNMQTALNNIQSGIISIAERNGFQTNLVLPIEERCLSPSDFGYHNTIKTMSGSLVFIDFEYAGWDDPAKLSADFFFQPKVPVPNKYYNEFLASCLSHLDKDRFAFHVKRANFLRPLFGLRWCCILLNPLRLEWAKARGLDQNVTKYRAICNNRINLASSILLRCQ